MTNTKEALMALECGIFFDHDGWVKGPIRPDRFRAYTQMVLEEAAQENEISTQQLLLLSGEMPAATLRAVKAALANRASSIRALLPNRSET